MLGKILKERYQIIQFLNAGVFGRTYIAEDIHQPSKPKCVIKHLKLASSDPNYSQRTRRRFASETETLRQLGNHEQIPQLWDFFEENQEFYLVQEFIPGHTLTTELPISCRGGLETRPHDKRWTENQVIELLFEVLCILKFVHTQGFIHCDLKPNNLIRRASDGKLFLIDFGAVQPISKQVRRMWARRGDDREFAIASPSPLGYIPAEQFTGNPQPNSDIYALGMMGIQAVTGLEPLQLQVDFTTGEVIWQHSVPYLSAQLASILNRMVSYDFKNRYQSAESAIQALEPLVAAKSEEAVVVGALLESIERETLPTATHSPTANSQQSLPTPQLATANTQPPTANTQPLSSKASPLLTGFAIGMVANSLVLTFGIYSLLHAFPAEPGTKTLLRATQEYQIGDLTSAIALARSIPANSPAYFEAQAAIREWRQDWQTAEEQFQATERALNDGRWVDVLEESRKIPYIFYWQRKVEPLVKQANHEIAVEAAHLLQKAYERASVRDFSGALRFLKHIPKETAAGAKIQQKLAEYTEKQRIRADYLLQKAYDRASTRDFTGALSFIKQIPKGTPAYDKAVPKVAEYVAKQRIAADGEKVATTTADSPQFTSSRPRVTVTMFEDFHPGNHLQEVNIH